MESCPEAISTVIFLCVLSVFSCKMPLDVCLFLKLAMGEKLLVYSGWMPSGMTIDPARGCKMHDHFSRRHNYGVKFMA